MASIRRLHANDPAPIRTILDAARHSLGAWPLYDMPALDTWHTDRVCLIGDAAHAVSPSTGQGASLAIEDAAVLARLLAETLSRDGAAGVPMAFAAYGAARAQRVARVQEESRSNGRNYHMGWPLSIARDFALKRLGPNGLRSRYGWLYDWQDAA